MENKALNGIKLVNAFGRYLDAQQIYRVGVLRLVQEKEKKMVSFNFLNGYEICFFFSRISVNGGLLTMASHWN